MTADRDDVAGTGAVVPCEGFRMTADRDDVAGTGAVVRKPPKNEPAMGERALCRTL
jgi:hypothetical protein